MYDIGSTVGLGDGALLVETIVALAGPNTEVFISGTNRLAGQLDTTAAAISAAFECCEVTGLDSTIVNPDRKRLMIRATGKRRPALG